MRLISRRVVLIRPFPQPGSVARFGYLACAGDLIYAVMKVRIGLANEIGIPGFPASAGAYETVANPLTAQHGNAGAGLLAALVVIVAVHLTARGLLRTIIATALVVATTVQLAGAAVLLLRVAGLLIFPGAQVSGWAAWFWALFTTVVALLYALTTAAYLRHDSHSGRPIVG